MNRQSRRQFLTKWAQAVPAATAPATPSAAAQSSGNKTIVSPPTQLDVWSAYPDTMKAYSANQNRIINNLTSRLGMIVNQLTNGKWNFQKLRDASFQFDPSEFADANTKNVMLFFLKLYKLLLNSGHAFSSQPINPQQLSNILAALTNAPELANLSQT